MTTKKRILVTDREPRWRRFIAAILQQAGYDVSSYEGMAESLQEIAEGELDLVLTDASLNEMTWELAVRHPGIRFMVFTTSPSVSEAVRSYRLGALDYRNKVFDVSTLLDSISEALTKPAARSQRLL